MARLPRVTAPELARAIQRAGFAFSRAKGAHQIFHNPTTGKRVTIPFHRGKNIPPGTLLNILRESGIDREELERLLKG